MLSCEGAPLHFSDPATGEKCYRPLTMFDMSEAQTTAVAAFRARAGYMREHCSWRDEVPHGQTPLYQHRAHSSQFLAKSHVLF